jgi:hypothetical protein
MTAPPTPKNAPRAHAVIATASWPVLELVVAMMTSILLHIAGFTLFVATAGFRPGPPWEVFAAAPEAVDEVIIGEPAPQAAPARTASQVVAKRELTSPPQPRPTRLMSPPSATPSPTPEPLDEAGSPPDQLAARPAGGKPQSAPAPQPRGDDQVMPSVAAASPQEQATTPKPATPLAASHASQIPPSEPVTRVPEPTPTPRAETVARTPEPTRETPAAPTNLPPVSAAPEFGTVATPRPSTPSPANAAAPVLPPISEPRPSRQMPALGPPTSDIAARAPIPTPTPATAAPTGPEPSEKAARLTPVGPPADEGLATSAGLTPPPAPASGGGPVDKAPARDVEAPPPLKAPPATPSPQVEPRTTASAQGLTSDSRSASPSIPSKVIGGDVSGEAANRAERSSSGTGDTTRQGGTAAVRGTSEPARAAADARTPQAPDSGRTPGAGAAERPGTPSPAAVAAAPSTGPGIVDPQQKAGTPPASPTPPQGGAVASQGIARPGTGVAGPEKSRGPGALKVVAPRDGLTLGGEDAPIVIVEGQVEDVEDNTTVWLVANGYRAPVRVRDGRFRHAMPVLERTTRLWIEATVAAGEPPRKSGEITVVNTLPGPISVLAIESPLNGGEQLQVTASWRPLADRFDGVVNGIPLRRFDAGRDVEPSTLFYMRHSRPGVFSLIVRGDAAISSVSTRLYHLLNGQFSVRDVRSVPIGSGRNSIAARILFPFGVEWNQREWFTGRAEGSDTITQFRLPEGVGWTERRIDLR